MKRQTHPLLNLLRQEGLDGLPEPGRRKWMM